jgi:DNA mismatch endonuclease (patch repair protein)
MKTVRQRDTAPELKLQKALRALGVKFRKNVVIPWTRRRADIFIPSAKVAVFVDGCFWHGCPKHATWPKSNSAWWRAKIERNISRDRDTDRKLRALGWKIKRVWAHSDPADAAHLVKRVVDKWAGHFRRT